MTVIITVPVQMYKGKIIKMYKHSKFPWKSSHSLEWSTVVPVLDHTAALKRLFPANSKHKPADENVKIPP